MANILEITDKNNVRVSVPFYRDGEWFIKHFTIHNSRIGFTDTQEVGHEAVRSIKIEGMVVASYVEEVEPKVGGIYNMGVNGSKG